jgi:integrase
MGRPLKGSIRRRGGHFLASVPVRRGATERREVQFATKTDAQAWLERQVERLDRGLDAEAAPRDETDATPVAASVEATSAGCDVPPTLTTLFTEWHREWYVSLGKADADRASAVERQVRMHVLPVLDHIYTLNRVEQRRLLLAWLVRMSGNNPAHRGVAPLTRKGYAADYVTSMLWALKMVAERATYMHELAPLPVAGLCAIEPLGKPKRKASLVSLVDAARIAQTMHVIHQIALWLLRLAGLRISEAYGLRVSSVVIDEDGDGFLLIDAQGGRTFQRYTEERDGIVKVTMKPTTKTDAGYRLVAIPAALTELLQVVVRVFHTHDGMIDPDARLIPAIRSETGGAAGFRTALTAVAADVFGGGDDDKPAGLVPHDLRKAFGTDLAWNNSIADVVARRAMGQRAGTDVFSLVYTLDSRLKEHLVPVAKALEDDLNANEVVVMQPTTRRPSFSKDRDPAEHARIGAALCAVGWHLSADDDDGISTAEAAALLGMSEQATRRLYPDVIPAWQDAAKSWWARHDDVIDYRDRFKGLHSLHDLAAEAQRSYHQMYQLAQHLDTTPVRDERKRECWYDDDDRDTLLAECRRVDALAERSMLVADAATALVSTTAESTGSSTAACSPSMSRTTPPVVDTSPGRRSKPSSLVATDRYGTWCRSSSSCRRPDSIATASTRSSSTASSCVPAATG